MTLRSISQLVFQQTTATTTMITTTTTATTTMTTTVYHLQTGSDVFKGTLPRTEMEQMSQRADDMDLAIHCSTLEKMSMWWWGR